MKKALKDVPGVDGTLFDHFQATFAKWRYETIALTMHVLLKFREVHETHLQPFMFEHVQDRNTINNVMATSKDNTFWVFVASCDKYVMFIFGQTHFYSLYILLFMFS